MFFYPENGGPSAPAVLRFGRPRRGAAAGQVRFIEREKIERDPARPRHFMDPGELGRLADSIRAHGILRPLYGEGGRYVLMEGEGRLRAAAMLGLAEVPCLVSDAETAAEDGGAAALFDILRRGGGDMFRQAEAMSELLRKHRFTQQEVAVRLGVSQSFVANKLRLLRFLPDERQAILGGNLTERHARALLRLCGDERLDAIRAAVEGHMNVARTEAYVEERLAGCASGRDENAEEAGGDRDLRAFLMAVERGVEQLRLAGREAQRSVEAAEGGVEVRILVK